MEGIAMTSKMENAGIDALKRLLMFVIREVTYFLSKNFGLIKRVDKGEITTVKDLES